MSEITLYKKRTDQKNCPLIKNWKKVLYKENQKKGKFY